MNWRQKKIGTPIESWALDPEHKARVIAARSPADARDDHGVEFKAFRLVNRHDLHGVIRLCVWICKQLFDLRFEPGSVERSASLPVNFAGSGIGQEPVMT